ncbi:McrA Restriction endonuclease [uncultured Caudovirales phage]|uniref:McrA Restriction endonuclease n=1 Tax=uncultured Caudovirales phage TaxID=2100421 RepID=A0A6J5RHT4_9CAUD|nr:McrA Restriction endonuclease [uncultured Caudovirales phage]
MSKKTLLLNASYEVLSFIPERKVFKLLFKDKVEVVSNWDDHIIWSNGKIKHPSILRLKNHVKRNYYNSNFSRKALIKRDKSTCQFCSKKLSLSQITIDHVLPRAQGGITSFTNCVVSCQICNNKKADKTPEQANMTLLKKPTHPSFSCQNYLADQQEYWCAEWDDFLSNT